MAESAVAKRYASALADVVTAAPSRDRAIPKPEDALAQLSAFEALLQSSEELKKVLITPAVPGTRKKAVVARLAGPLGLSTVTRNFLFVLLDHRRIGALADILQSLEVILDERLGFVRAEVISASELSETQRSALNRELERVSGKRIRMRFAVDPALIGGAVARIGSTVYDGSVRGQLESLERRLSAAV
jgi:F-type H+-transporting ATPase subunit delta